MQFLTHCVRCGASVPVLQSAPAHSVVCPACSVPVGAPPAAPPMLEPGPEESSSVRARPKRDRAQWAYTGMVIFGYVAFVFLPTFLTIYYFANYVGRQPNAYERGAAHAPDFSARPRTDVASADSRKKAFPGKVAEAAQERNAREEAAVAGETPSRPATQPLPPEERPLAIKRVELQPRWKATASDVVPSRFHYDPVANVLVLKATDGIVTLDGLTGNRRHEFAAATTAKGSALFPLDSGRFATLAAGRSDLDIWDAKTGKLVERLSMPAIPKAAGATHPYVAVSPNQKYIAVGWMEMDGRDRPAGPFRVVQAAIRKPLISFDWLGGSVHFTADSSRVLVAERTGRVRWFKLPSGEEDGGWKRPPSADDFSVHAISADGGIVACTSGNNEEAGGEWPMAISGRTGRPVRAFNPNYYDPVAVTVTADGRWAALRRTTPLDGDQTEYAIDLIDIASGAVFNRARIGLAASPPAFAFTPDGLGLVVLDAAHAVWFFDAVAP